MMSSQEREAHFNKEPTHEWGKGDPLPVSGQSHAKGGPKPLPVGVEHTTPVWGQAKLWAQPSIQTAVYTVGAQLKLALWDFPGGPRDHTFPN